MTMQETTRTARKISRRRTQSALTPSTANIAAYVVEVTQGVRELTRGRKQRDLRFLDYLLAMAEAEAASLSAQTFH
jgi:hypothetical protein